MKIIRYIDLSENIRYGAEGSAGVAYRVEGDVYSDFFVTNEPARVRRLLAPVAVSQILCIGLNYRRHANETGAPIPERPILFAKGVNTVCGPEDPIELPTYFPSHEVDYECELAVVIGRPCKNATPANALSYVLGYTCCNDVSARDHQLKLGGGQWCRGKFFDTFAPLGPRLVTSDELPNPNALRIQTRLNGAVVQDSTTADMIFDVPSLITYLSGSTTLVPGTVILTGTPEGVGMATKPQPRWLQPGDRVEVEIEHIGVLANSVRNEVLQPNIGGSCCR